LSIALAALVATGTLGCEQASPKPTGAGYASEFEEARRLTTSQYLLDVLADDQITEAEITEARSRFVSCLADAGIWASFVRDDYGEATLIMSDKLTSAQQAAESSCDHQWLGPIASLYHRISVNPYNVDWDELVAACLVQKGLAPKGFTGAQYRELEKSSGVSVDTTTMEPDTNGRLEMTYTTPPLPAATLPSGVTLDNPEAIWCSINPLH
jgi:hypothetical protein